MRKGSVIIDLAAQTGGNCVYTQQNKAVVSPNGVTVVGDSQLVLCTHLEPMRELHGAKETNYPAQMAAQSSEMLGSNFTALLEASRVAFKLIDLCPQVSFLGYFGWK